MASRVVVFGIIFVILIGFLAFSIEFFVPLSAKSDMNILCRNTLIKMEVNGGLLSHDRDKLYSRLSERGFKEITITGSGNAKQGEEINLCVEADYAYNKLTGIFIRSEIIQHMVYNKTSIARRVVN